jgi:hypothetical protein
MLLMLAVVKLQAEAQVKTSVATKTTVHLRICIFILPHFLVGIPDGY